MKKSRLLLFALYIITAVFQLLEWFKCRQLNDVAHYSNASLLFHVEEFVHNDSDLPRLLVRAIHNKITVFIPDAIHAYLHFWDIHFLTYFLTLMGVVGVILGFWYVWEQKRKRVLLGAGVLLVLPFIEVFFYQYISYIPRMLLLWIPLQLFSLYGLWIFLSKKKAKRVAFVSIILALSILWCIIFNSQLFSYCIK